MQASFSIGGYTPEALFPTPGVVAHKEGCITREIRKSGSEYTQIDLTDRLVELLRDDLRSACLAVEAAQHSEKK